MITGNPHLDFLEQNPSLAIKDFFYYLVEERPDDYSTICWALWYLEDPDSPLYNSPREIRKNELKTNYYPDVDWDDIERYTKKFLNAIMPKEKLLYKIAYDKLEDLTYDLQEKDLNDDKQWRQTVTLMEKLPKIWESMDRLKIKYDESLNKSSIKGGGSESPREKRMNG